MNCRIPAHNTAEQSKSRQEKENPKREKNRERPNNSTTKHRKRDPQRIIKYIRQCDQGGLLV
jgi:hypothetical protein